MMPKRLLLTLLAALVIATAAVVSLARERAGGRDVMAEFLSVPPGARDGMAVTYLGVNAGFVRKIDVSSGRVVMTLRIRRADVGLHSGDGVRMRPIGVFGDQVVEIVRGRGRSSMPFAVADTLREAR